MLWFRSPLTLWKTDKARFNVVRVACGRIGDSLRNMPDDSVVRVALVLMALADGDAAQVFAVSLSRIHPKRNGDRMNHARRSVTTDSCLAHLGLLGLRLASSHILQTQNGNAPPLPRGAFPDEQSVLLKAI